MGPEAGSAAPGQGEGLKGGRALALQLAARPPQLSLLAPCRGCRRDIKAIVEGPPAKLIESVAERIAARILEGHPAVTAVRVGVHKPQVAVRGVVGSLGVEIERLRGQP